jgi:hypothetical protein
MTRRCSPDRCSACAPQPKPAAPPLACAGRMDVTDTQVLAQNCRASRAIWRSVRLRERLLSGWVFTGALSPAPGRVWRAASAACCRATILTWCSITSAGAVRAARQVAILLRRQGGSWDQIRCSVGEAQVRPLLALFAQRPPRCRLGTAARPASSVFVTDRLWPGRRPVARDARRRAPSVQACATARSASPTCTCPCRRRLRGGDPATCCTMPTIGRGAGEAARVLAPAPAWW